MKKAPEGAYSGAMREPFFGPNAKPFFIQSLAGVATYHFLSWIGVGDLFYWLSCSFLTGTCS